MPVAARLKPFGSTVFATVTRLAAEHDAINLGQGYPDFDGPQHVKRAAIDAINAGHGQYARTQGVPLLNEAIAVWFERASGLAVDPHAQVTVTSGCTEAIPATCLGLLNPGDEVVLFEPYYDSYPVCVALAGATARYVTLHAPEFRFDEKELRAAFTKRTRAVVINTPNNPTGRVFSRQELQLIADLAIEHGAIVISDEVYERLVFEGEHVCIASLPGMAERTVTLSSLGKTFSLTGWKIGWTIASPKLTKGVRAAHQFLTYATATPLQHAAAVALASPQSYFDEFVSSYRRKRDLMCDALKALGFGATPPQGTYFILADHSAFGFKDDVAFCTHLVEKVGVAAIPPTAFYERKERGKNLVRFAFCKKDETLHSAIGRMSRLK